MPVILKRGGEKEWLHRGGMTICRPFPSELMTAHPVSPKSKASNNRPDAMQPVILA
jgi:putative SOS response-associated peptidase YedK